MGESMRAILVAAVLAGCVEPTEQNQSPVLVECGPPPVAPDLAKLFSALREIDGVKYWTIPADDAAPVIRWRDETNEWNQCAIGVR